MRLIDFGLVLGLVDGIHAMDVTGNGLLDILAGNEQGVIGWYEQTSEGQFTRHTIHGSAIGGGSKQEGGAWIDVDGDGHLEVVRVDQARGEISIFKQDTPGSPTGTWTRAVIKTGRPNLQWIGGIDLDGDGREEIVYTWEGTEDGEGGVNWLDWQSGDVLDPDNYNDHVIVQHNGGWWIGGARDFSGNGHGLDLLFSARDARNGDADPGVFWLEKPETVTDPWTPHTIVSSAHDWLQIDLGDFFGNGVDTDVAAIRGPRTPDSSIHLFDSSNEFSETTLSVGHDTQFNVKRAGFQQNGRDALYISGDGINRIYVWSGSAWVVQDSFNAVGMKVDSRVPIIPMGEGQALALFDSINARFLFWTVGPE